MPAAFAPAAEHLVAPGDWATVDLLSDLHLSPAEPATLAAFETYLQQTPADAVAILGDLFEVWVGDDAAADTTGFEHAVVSLLRATSRRLHLYVMHGNRDFLLGTAFYEATGASPLADPTLLELGNRRWLLSHGDALCLGDIDYQRFRAQVRSPAWQQAFLQQPLAHRRTLVRDMRERSRAAQRTAKAGAATDSNADSGASTGSPVVDIDDTAATAWLHAAGASVLVHGHTHRPAQHGLGDAGLLRIVLTDWDLACQAPRAGVLRLWRDGRWVRVLVAAGDADADAGSVA